MIEYILKNTLKEKASCEKLKKKKRLGEQEFRLNVGCDDITSVSLFSHNCSFKKI